MHSYWRMRIAVRKHAHAKWQRMCTRLSEQAHAKYYDEAGACAVTYLEWRMRNTVISLAHA